MKAFLTSEDKEIFNGIKHELARTTTHLQIIAPFILPEVLDCLLNSVEKPVKISIITTWDLNDLKAGASSLNLYAYCRKNGFFLYLNSNVHLKAFIIDDRFCMFGSANITNRGMSTRPSHNYEIMSNPVTIGINERIYFSKILKEAILVNDKIFTLYESAVNNLNIEMVDGTQTRLNDYSDFLISSLPMTKSPDLLLSTIKENFNSNDTELINCVVHDIALFDILLDANRECMLNALKSSFFCQPFIVKLIEFIEQSEEGVYFGELKEWVQKTCTDVPIPSRRSLTENVKVLYQWLLILGDGMFVVDRPNYSERIRYFRK